MRTLSEIIDECKLNGEPSYDELKYSVLVLTAIANTLSYELNDLYYEGKMPNDLIREMKLKNGICTMYRNALNKSPKEFIGWRNDPENPQYQKFHFVASKLVEKALDGTLPNQKK